MYHGLNYDFQVTTAQWIAQMKSIFPKKLLRLRQMENEEAGREFIRLSLKARGVEVDR